jgi:hypothetical protein
MREFYGTRYQSGSFSSSKCGEWIFIDCIVFPVLSCLVSGSTGKKGEEAPPLAGFLLNDTPNYIYLNDRASSLR